MYISIGRYFGFGVRIPTQLIDISSRYTARILTITKYGCIAYSYFKWILDCYDCKQLIGKISESTFSLLLEYYQNHSAEKSASPTFGKQRTGLMFINDSKFHFILTLTLKTISRTHTKRGLFVITPSFWTYKASTHSKMIFCSF